MKGAVRRKATARERPESELQDRLIRPDRRFGQAWFLDRGVNRVGDVVRYRRLRWRWRRFARKFRIGRGMEVLIDAFALGFVRL